MRRAQSRRAQSSAEQCGDLAREAENRQAISPIRRDFDVEHDVVEVQIRGHFAAERCVGAERENPRVILRQAELALRTEHALRLHAANYGCLQRRLLAKLRANESERRNHAGLHVGRAAHDFELAFGAGIHVDQIQPVRVRMLLDVDDARREHARESGSELLDVLDHQPRET